MSLHPMRSFTLMAVCLLTAACLSAQTPAPPPGDRAPAFDGARAFRHLERLVEIGPRPSGSAGAQHTRDYITREMTALGLTLTEQAFEATTPAGPLKMVNLRVLIPSTRSGQAPSTAPSDPPRLIVAGHYDTKRFDEFRFVGANDAGSSTAFLIELARVLKERTNALPIELLFLDGEEAIGEWETGNTYGSRHYVASAREAGTLDRIKALILVDMIADRELVLKREENSTPWLTDAIWSAAARLGKTEFVQESTTVEDDHLPFLAAGVPAVDIIDLEYPDASMRYWHTAGDTLDHVSAHGLQVVGDVLLAALPAIELRVR